MLLQTPQADVGTQAPSFSLPDLDGRVVSLQEVLGPGGLVVAFICNHCPYVRAIIDDFVSDAKELKQHGVNTVAIMSNDYRFVPADSPPQMRAFAKRHGIDFPYLLDEGQQVARAYGAVCTPDFFGYDRHGTLRYRGRLDNGNINRPKNRVKELVAAMRHIAETGTTPDNQVRSIGCSIKWRLSA